MTEDIILHGQKAIEIKQNDSVRDSHWHEETVEIVLILRGTVVIRIVESMYELHEDEMIFVNKWMVHQVEEASDDASFLTFRFNLQFFEEHIPNVSKVFFVRRPDEHTEDKLAFLRTLLATIATARSFDEMQRDKVIMEASQKLFKSMIKDFNYIKKNPEMYRDEHSFNRIWSILRYLLDNHSSKISLPEVAKHVHVSSSYLSHCIKKETGRSFEDWLNAFRAEHAARLLISTNISIVKLSYMCGFSDPKYLSKHFKRLYKHYPSEYRKKHKRAEDNVENATQDVATKQDKAFIETKLKSYLIGKKEIKALLAESQLLEFKISFGQIGKSLTPQWKDYLFTGSFSKLYMNDVQQFLTKAQEEIGFKFAIISYPFDIDEIEMKNGKCNINLPKIIETYDFLYSVNLQPCILLNTEKHSKKDFIIIVKTYFEAIANFYGREVEKWRIFVPENFETYEVLQKISESCGISLKTFNLDSFTTNCKYETVPESLRFLEEAIFENKSKSQTIDKLFDVGLIKPLYWVYCFLSELGSEVLTQGKDYVVTREKDKLQILTWNHSDNHEHSHLENAKKIAIEVSDLLESRYIIKKIAFDKNSNCIHNRFTDSRAIKYLTNKEKTALNESCKPRIHYGYAENTTQVSLQDTLLANGMLLYVISPFKR